MWWFILEMRGTSGTSKGSVVICLKTTWYVSDDCVLLAAVHEQIAENKILLAKKHKSISIPKSFVI